MTTHNSHIKRILGIFPCDTKVDTERIEGSIASSGAGLGPQPSDSSPPLLFGPYHRYRFLDHYA